VRISTNWLAEANAALAKDRTQFWRPHLSVLISELAASIVTCFRTERDLHLSVPQP
jgi:hypothetical protein